MRTYLCKVLRTPKVLFLMFIPLQEWRAKQIASGEAKDNANFQPLGGDWYETPETVNLTSIDN